MVYHLGTEVKRARELGSYQLEEKLGRGRDGGGLARPASDAGEARRHQAHPAVARRETRGAGVSEEALRRFEREAQVIARLRSPHTVELFDFGVAADGAFYYVMELLDGLDADTLLRRFGPTPPERAVFLLRQVCHSLSEAESCGLVHRDIKPANIFLCRYGEEYDFVKVLDFGIVKAAARRRRRRTRCTPARTPSRARPRSWRPSRRWAAEVDGRADIYATGCVAYWLLTGQFVFTADTLHGAPDAARAGPARAAVDPDGPADSRGARPARAVVPGQGPRGSAAVGQGAVAPARRDRGASTLDPGPGAGLVGDAPAGIDFVKPACTDS